jgi:SPP1 gp7 family putative phage head morphogenesis protein
VITEQTHTAEEQQALLLRLQRFTIGRVNRLENGLIADLRDAYTIAARELLRTVGDAFLRFGASNWSITDVGQPQRQVFLFGQIIDRIDALTSRIALDMNTALGNTYRDSYYMRAWAMQQGSPLGVVLNLPVLPEQAVIAALTYPYDGANFFERLGDARVEFITKVRRSIVASQIEGETIRQAQKRIANELGWPISRRTKAEAVANKGHYAKTEMIARTEMLRMSNLGAAAIDAQNQDILVGWQWIATRDDRTCPICAPLDGRVFKQEERARPPIHPRCRCTSVPETKSFEALGFRGVRSEFPKRETYREWRDNQGV